MRNLALSIFSTSANVTWNRYRVVKQIYPFELHMNYLKYEFFILVFFQRPTALAKIVGAFRIGFRNNQTNNDLKQDLLVMENLFYNCSISQVRFVIVLNSLA